MSTRKSSKPSNFPEQAKNLQHFMEIERLNIQDISAVCGFSYYNFRNWKAGVHKVPALALEKMKEVYGLNPEWIIGRSTKMYLRDPNPAQQSQPYPPAIQAAGGDDAAGRKNAEAFVDHIERHVGKRKR